MAKKRDWRSRPRKPAALKKGASMTLRVTAAELREIKRLAKAAGKTMRDYIIDKVLSP